MKFFSMSRSSRCFPDNISRLRSQSCFEWRPPLMCDGLAVPLWSVSQHTQCCAMTVESCLLTLVDWDSKLCLISIGSQEKKMSYQSEILLGTKKKSSWEMRMRNHHYQTTLLVISHETMHCVRVCTLKSNFYFTFRILIRFVSFKNSHFTLLPVFLFSSFFFYSKHEVFVSVQRHP